VGFVQPGHVVEIHAENPGDEPGGHEHGGHHGEGPDFPVHPVAHRGKIDVQQAREQVPQVFQGFQKMDRVVIHVPQVELGFRAEKIPVAALQGVEHLPQGPDGAAQGRDLALDPVNVLDQPGAELVQNHLFHVLRPVGKLLHQGEIPVHQGIQEGIGQIVRPQAQHLIAVAPQALPQGVEGPQGPLLEGENEVWPQDDAHLVAGQGAPFRRAGVEPGDDEEVIPVIVHLGPLVRIQNVFQHQGVELEALADGGHESRVVEAVNIEPEHLAPAFQVEHLVLVPQFPLLQPFRVVFQQVHGGGGHAHLPQVDQGPGGQAGFAGAEFGVAFHDPGMVAGAPEG